MTSDVDESSLTVSVYVLGAKSATVSSTMSSQQVGALMERLRDPNEVLTVRDDAYDQAVVMPVRSIGRIIVA
jgi:hypothetical protein